MRSPIRGIAATFGLSVGASALLALVGLRSAAVFALAPALLLSAFVSLGHLITIDDDAPGGWSNPDGSAEIWRGSLVALAVKLLVFLGVCAAAAWLWTTAP